MNILFVCLDSVRYDTFHAANARNMKSIGPLKKVHAVACCTVPAITAYLFGFPPIGSGRKNLFRRDVRQYTWAPKFFAEKGWATAWISSNPHILMFDSGLNGAFRRHFKHFRSGDLTTPMIVANVEEILSKEATSIFMCILIMDTHRPYLVGDHREDIDPKNPEKNFKNQVKAIEIFDGVFPAITKPFRGRGDTEVIITSDHGELFGPDYWSHDPTTPYLKFDNKLFEIPLVTGIL